MDRFNSEFSRAAQRRRVRRQNLRILMLILVLLGVVVGAGMLYKAYFQPAVSAGGEAESTSAEAQQESADSEMEQETVMPAADAGAFSETAAVPQEPVAELQPETLDSALWNTGVAVTPTLNLTVNAPDWRMLALPASPAVEASYFDTATFVGDSLTQGLQLYQTGLPNAHYCAYKGTGPNAVVNGATLTRADGGTEICLDALAASAPDYVYILLGTNSLVSQGNDDSFINYYSAMIDLFKTTLPQGVIYYVQAIPAVAADVVNSKPGLDNDRIRTINSRLAQLALEKGCYFIDLQEALADAEGNQIAEYAAADGIHFNATGYQAWVDYLCTHTAYHKRNPYRDGNPYYIDIELLQ